jgi:hypothetical protein
MKHETFEQLSPEDERRGIVWQVAGGGYIGALCHAAPGEVVLSSLIEASRSSAQPVTGVFIEDLRGGLAAARTSCLRRLSSALDAPVVIMTSSPFARGGATASRWLGERVFAFGRRGLDEAFGRLGVPELEQTAIRAALRALRVARNLERRHCRPRGATRGAASGVM